MLTTKFLVVHKESYLADFGSLSYRFKDVSIGHEKENKDIENTETKENNSKVNCKLKVNISSAKKN